MERSTAGLTEKRLKPFSHLDTKEAGLKEHLQKRLEQAKEAKERAERYIKALESALELLEREPGIEMLVRDRFDEELLTPLSNRNRI